MKRYKLIGLTGQTGAGKSTAAAEFAALGAELVNADELVSALYAEDSPCVKTIAACFGAAIVGKDGGVNRRLLAQRAFSSKENTALLGRLVHPFVTAALFERLRGKTGIVIYDAPQLFESGADVICDRVIAVLADEDIRIRRIIVRDRLTEQQAYSRVRAQYDERFFRENADDLLENNGDEAGLRQSAASLYESLKREVK